MARLPPSVRLLFAALCNCLRVLSNRLSSISVASFQRLLYALLDFLRFCQPRKPPCQIPHLSQLVDSFPSTRSVVPSGIAASTLPTTPSNASVMSIDRSSSASIPGSVAITPEIHPLQRPPRVMIPFVASVVQRYEKKVQIEPSRGKESIRPMEQYPDHLPDSANWKAYVHPEAALYFCQSLKSIFTDMDAKMSLADINACTDVLCALAERNGVELTDNIELTVRLGSDPDTGNPICHYYFVDRDKRTLFWLHPLDTESLFEGVRGVQESSHIRWVIQFQYWIHCELYPKNRSEHGLLRELRETVIHASADLITSDKSLSPFGGKELSKILNLISHLQETTSYGYSPCAMCVVARFMQYFARAKFFNFYGQPCARLGVDRSIYLMKDKHVVKSAIFWVVELLRFGAPQAHLIELQKAWVDKNTTAPRWKDFNDKVGKEWISIALYPTVMLTVDINFLILPSTDVQTSHSAAIIMAYLSTFCIVRSLFVSIFLAGQNRKYGNVSADSRIALPNLSPK